MEECDYGLGYFSWRNDQNDASSSGGLNKAACRCCVDVTDALTDMISVDGDVEFNWDTYHI